MEHVSWDWFLPQSNSWQPSLWHFHSGVCFSHMSVPPVPAALLSARRTPRPRGAGGAVRTGRSVARHGHKSCRLRAGPSSHRREGTGAYGMQSPTVLELTIFRWRLFQHPSVLGECLVLTLLLWVSMGRNEETL